jgi:N-acetyl-anhydromuramyl-L-alanine amidase AmpD
MLIPIIIALQALTVRVHHLPKRNVELRDTTYNFIVIHNDDAGNYDIARKTLIQRKLSYHYYIRRNGQIIELLEPQYAASHVGYSYWNGLVRMNRYTIGICLENKPPQEYVNEQYIALSRLILMLQGRYPDSTSRVIVGHENVAIPFGRKHDPGQQFNWAYLRTLIELQKP